MTHRSPNPPRVRSTAVCLAALIGALRMGAPEAAATTAGIMGGGSIYGGGQPVMDDLRASGFNTVILWTMHVYYPSGDLVFNNQPAICTGGVYNGKAAFPGQLATLRQAPTSVSRIEVAVGSGGGPNDFLAIQKLIEAQGTGTNSILYRNFKALLEATGADAVCFNDETLYDVATMVTFGQMVAALGKKVTLCPYTNASVWQNVKSQLGATVDAVYLQCYSGGAGNNPATWNNYFGGLKVSPGLWCKHGDGCTLGDSASAVSTKMSNWRASPGIPGGWMWIHDDMQKCTASSMGAYAVAITGVTPPPPSTVTWDGGGANNAWMTGANWDGNVAPTSGATLHFAGSTRLTPSNNFASGTAMNSIYFDSGAGSFTLRGNPVALSWTIENNSSATQTVEMPIVLSTGATVYVRTILGSGDLTLRGIISGAGSLEKQVQAVNATTAILAGSNTYSGETTILAGNLSISSIRNMGSPLPSSVGMPAPGNGTIAMGTASRLIYTGTGDTTDRGIDFAGTGNPTLTQNGTGLLKFTGPFTASVDSGHALTLNGTGTGEIAGAIQNADTANTRIIKDGTGTWVLSGANVYAGSTAVRAGTLALAGGGSISSSSAIDVASTATLDVIALSDVFTVGTVQSLTGAGTIRGSLSCDGTISPGAGSTAATLTVVGNASFNPNAVYRVDVGPSTNDLLLSTGDVNLGGATLVVTGAPTAGAYVILSAGGTLSGTFDSLPNGAVVPFTGYTIHYATGGSPACVVMQKIVSPIKHVIHISVDGMHADAPRTLVDKGVGPNFARLFAEGAYTEHARSDYDSTVTSPNHASMFTGRPTFDWPGKPGHLWGNNDTHPWDQWGLTLHAAHFAGTYYGPGPTPMFTNAFLYGTSPNKTNFEYVSSVLDVVHDSGGSTSMSYSKDRIRIEEQSYGATHGRRYPNLDANDAGVGKVDYSEYTGPFGVLSNWIPAMVSNFYEYSFLHFSLPDDRGHSFSWSLTSAWRADETNFVDAWNTNLNKYVGASYMGAIQQVDVYLGQVFDLIETNEELNGRTAVVLTADHGGLLGAFDHGFIAEPDCFGVDLFVWGPGIPAGVDLYALNRQYTDPGRTNRPDFNDPHQPIRNGDTANLVLSLLGLGPIPGSSLDFDQGLGAVDSDGDGLSDNYERSIATDPFVRDTDGDGASDGDELYAGTSPTNAASVFAISVLNMTSSPPAAVVTWSSIANRSYTLWGSTNPSAGFSVITSALPATPFANAYTNELDGSGPMLYRVSVGP